MKVIISALAASSVAFGVSAEPVAAAAATWVTVNSVADYEQRSPAIAASRTGYVAVAWEDDRDSTNPGSNLRSQIFVRVYKDGNPLFEKRVSGGGSSGVTTWRHIMPDVGVDDKGNTVVVWADDPDGNGYYNVPYVVLSPSGAVRASGRANASAAGQQTWPKVSVDPDGTPTLPSAVAFTVVWEDKQGSNAPTVKASGYTNLTTKAYEVTVNLSGGTHRRPDVAVSANGNALFVWEDDRDGNGYYQIGLVRRAKSNGAVNLTHRSANSNGGGQQLKPTIDATFNGEFAIAWESDHTGTVGVWARSFSASGAPRHDDVEVSTGAGARKPSVGIDDQSNIVVCWTVSGVDTWGRGFNPDGTGDARLAAGGLMRVSEGEQRDIVVAVSPWGEVNVAYRDDNDGNTWGQIYMGQAISNSNW